MDEQKKNTGTIIKPYDGGLAAVEINRSQLEEFFNQYHKLGHGKSELAKEIRRFIDKCPQYKMPGGFGHRIYWGHSLSDGIKVYKKYGVKGVIEWNKHLAKDFTSPDGLPLPFAKKLAEILDLNVHEATEFLSYNLVDLVASSLAAMGIVNDIVSDAPPLSKFARGVIVEAIGCSTKNTLMIVQGAGAIIGSFVGFILERGEILELNMEGFENIQDPVNIDYSPIRTEFENFKNIDLREQKKMSNLDKLTRKFQSLKFSEEGLPFIYKVEAEGIDGCKVSVHTGTDTLRAEIADLRGLFHVDNRAPQIKKNVNQLPDDLLNNIYHMVRSKGLYNYNKKNEFYEGYLYFYGLAVKTWNEYVEKNIDNLNKGGLE